MTFLLSSPTAAVSSVRLFYCRERLSQYENPANSRLLIGKRSTLIGFPPSVRGGHGAPVRAVALLPE